jgi:hypothetical protein
MLSPENRALAERELALRECVMASITTIDDGLHLSSWDFLNRLLDAARAEGRQAAEEQRKALVEDLGAAIWHAADQLSPPIPLSSEQADAIADLIRTAPPKMREARPMTEDQIKHMVQRFLGWRLPENFNPDGGISFKPTHSEEYMASLGKPPMRHDPVGTNLFDATQAEAMVRHMVEGLPAPPTTKGEG